ncbi:MAG: hypothetical protein JNL58_11850 [Planctomyces sp.]|nr:hypothetical protein [Planctomyces sp.]
MTDNLEKENATEVQYLSDDQVFVWLRRQLEPKYTVVSNPGPGYFEESRYNYAVFDGDTLLAEFHGEFGIRPAGELAQAARALVRQLHLKNPLTDNSQSYSRSLQQPTDEHVMKHVVATRLPPRRNPRTWFGSGRAAFTFLLQAVVKPRRIWLPGFICWSLPDVIRRRFPAITISFYHVDRSLKCHYPDHLQEGDAIVVAHFFGAICAIPEVPSGVTILEDLSHVLISDGSVAGHFRFGSLRKVLRLADGGFVDGCWNPSYESGLPEIRWLRTAARDWRDLREAENMLDRNPAMNDMSSQSLAALLSSDLLTIAEIRRRNEAYLSDHFPIGESLVSFSDQEVPLLHIRRFESEILRDRTRRKLAEQQIFCSIHWPVHPVVRSTAAHAVTADADWLERHSLCIPISEDYDLKTMQRICEAASEVDV